jgi:AcrR family transcriptional regulator
MVIRSPRAPRLIERRRRILEAVRDAIVRDGIDEVRVRSLASDCGVAVATLYNQFGSRDGLIAAALEQDFRGRYEPLSFKTRDWPAAEKFSRRVVKAARDIYRMREYTGAVLSLYFRPGVEPILRSVVHDFIAADFRGIVDGIAAAGDLQDWVDRDKFANDIVPQMYAITMMWLQGHIAERDLQARLLQVGAIAFAGISKGETRIAFEAIARQPTKIHHRNATASRPAIRP